MRTRIVPKRKSLTESTKSLSSTMPTPSYCKISSRALTLAIVVACASFQPNSANAEQFDTSLDKWGLLVGYGQSFPGWGQTTQRVETVDLVPRYTHRMFSDIGAGWYRGSYSTLVELPVHAVISSGSAMLGANFLACYTLNANSQMRPYIFGGGGPVYSFADISGMGAKLNGNYQFGIGLELPWTKSSDLSIEFRYHHISNGGSDEPNEPLNSCKILIGVTL